MGRHEEFEAHMDQVYRHLPRIAVKGGKFIEFAISAYGSADYRTGLRAKVAKFKWIEPYAKMFSSGGIANQIISVTHNMPYLHRSNLDYSDLVLEEGCLETLGATFGVLLGPEWRYMKPCLSAGFHYERNMLGRASESVSEALAQYGDDNRIEGFICMLTLQHSVLWRQGRCDEAERVLRRLTDTTHDEAEFFIPNLAAYRVRLALADGDADVARTWLDNYFVTDIDHVDLISSYRQFTTVRAYLALGDIDRAAAHIEILKDFGSHFSRPIDVCEARFSNRSCCGTSGGAEMPPRHSCAQWRRSRRSDMCVSWPMKAPPSFPY